MTTIANPGPHFLGWPTTRPGAVALRLFATALVAVFIAAGLSGLWFGVFEPSGGEQESPPFGFQVPMVGAALAGFAAGMAGGYFALRALLQGDRSVFLVLPLAAFAMAATFVVGEFAVPH